VQWGKMKRCYASPGGGLRRARHDAAHAGVPGISRPVRLSTDFPAAPAQGSDR
jgi:hypothetical protein